MKSANYLKTLPFLMLAASCASVNGTAGFRNHSGLEKAAFDLGCDKSELVVTEISDYSVGVAGCGQRARYERVDAVTWVLNSKIEK